MKISSVLSLSGLGAGSLAQSGTDAFEPVDFNATAALLDVGVNVSVIPELVGLESRSSLSACKIAVKPPICHTMCQSHTKT
jgi:hypothetical protein